MPSLSRLPAVAGVLLSLCVATPAGAAYADSDSRRGDPSGRVARLSDVQGEVSYSPAGEDEWTDTVRNRPFIRGDRLWTDGNARVELQVGNAALRLGADSSFELLDLSDRVAQFRLTQGTLNLRVRRLYPGQSYEVATPTLAFHVTRPGRYRVDVDRRDDQTTVVVWEGAGEAYGEHSRFPLRAGDTARFYGDDLRDHDLDGLPRADAFDRYCLARDRRLDRSASLRYLDADVVGYADLDEHGSWRAVRGYGTAWFPSRVSADWAPYRDGHWVWQEPWGWTWVDHAPWGFAPSHYGRWVHVSNRWGWVPGPRNVRAVYAPALVAFVGGGGWSVSLSLGQGSPVGWFPLGPREAYVPAYRASRDYFTRVNVNNTVINNTTITNVYNNNYGSNNTNTSVTQVNHANRTVAGAVTVVPSAVFVNARPVQPAAIRIEAAALTAAEVTRVAPVAPTSRSVRGSGADARVRPSREAQDRRVVARSAPPPAPRAFAAREPELQRAPGQVPPPAAAPPVATAPVTAAPGTDPKVRVITEQPGAVVDARAAGSRRGGRGAADRAEPGPGRAAAAPAPEPDPQQAGASAQEEQRQREEQKAAQQDAERQRVADKQQQQERRVKAEGDAKAAQQDAERQRVADRQQQQEQRRLKAEGDAKAARQEREERERVADARRLEQAECERQAVEKKQDKRRCEDKTPPAKGPRKDKRGNTVSSADPGGD